MSKELDKATDDYILLRNASIQANIDALKAHQNAIHAKETYRIAKETMHAIEIEELEPKTLEQRNPNYRANLGDWHEETVTIKPPKTK